MKRLPAGTLAVLSLVAVSLSAQESPTGDQERITLLCGVAPPASAEDWHALAEAILRVRLTSQFAYEVEGPEVSDWAIMTEHETVLLDVYKPHSDLLVPGAVQTILQFGGTIQKPTGRRIHTFNEMPPLPEGTEWILFLRWDRMARGFVVAHFEHGAFGTQNGVIVPMGDSEFARQWRGRPVEELEEALRAAARP